MPKAKKDAWIIEIVTRTATKSDGTQECRVETTKVPVTGIADATIRFVGAMQSRFRNTEDQNELMTKWLAALVNKQFGVTQTLYPPKHHVAGIWTENFEYIFQPWTAEDRDDYEKAVGIQKDVG